MAFGKRVPVIVALFVATLSLGAYLGFELSRKLEIEFSKPSRFVKKVSRGFGALFKQEWPTQVVVSSNRLNLSLTNFSFPLEFRNGGGGSSGDGEGGVLAVDIEGRIFQLQDPSLVKLDIEVPDSKVDVLRRQFEAGELGSIGIRFGQFRYNDVLVHRSGDKTDLLVSYTEWHPDERCFTSTLAKTPLAPPPISGQSIVEGDWEIVARTRPCLALFEYGFGVRGAEAGGRLASGPGSTVLWTSGVYNRDDHFDKARPESSLAQSDDTDYGKVLSVDLETGAVRSIAKGLRNPQGIDFDADGHALVTDHGMRGGDELNVVREGANFGFPLVTLGTKYSSAPGGLEPFHTGHQGYDRPLVAFVPAIAPSSVLLVRGFHPDWDGNILIGGLRRELHRVHVEDGKVLFVEPIDVGIRIRDMVRMGEGRIAALTDDNLLVLIEPGPPAFQFQAFQTVLDAEPDPDTRAAAKVVFNACLECHGLEEDRPAEGPTLFRVCGRKPGTDKASGYSGALEQAANVWDQGSLLRFISDPAGAAPGTTMAFEGLANPKVAGLLAKSFCQLGVGGAD